MKLQVQYQDQDTEITEKTKIFDKLKQRRDIQLKEKEELEQEHEQQQNLFMDQKKELEKEINKKKAIVNALIPLEYQNIIFSLSQYNEEKDEWFIPEFEEMKTYSRKNPQLAMGYDDEDNCKLFILFTF